MRFEWDFGEIESFFDEHSSSSLGEVSKQITQEIAKALLKVMRNFTPKEDGVLLHGWDGNRLLVTLEGDYYKVSIVNKTPYALYVNDGHRSYNQFGGPYRIKHRVKLKTPYKWQRGGDEWYVYGHFFVERGILKLTQGDQIETIIMNELQEWWLGGLSG